MKMQEEGKPHDPATKYWDHPKKSGRQEGWPKLFSTEQQPKSNDEGQRRGGNMTNKQ
jgi:hypothetical protein